jgi:hypothetical protein
VPKKKAAKKKAKSTKVKISAKTRALKKKPAAKAKKKVVQMKKPAPKKLAASTKKKGTTYDFEEPRVTPIRRDASERAGQSGDLQGLSDVEEADSESVDELLEEGQSFEAEAVSGVENAPDADRGPVRTHEVPEDDVPEEYRENDDQ